MSAMLSYEEHVTKVAQDVFTRYQQSLTSIYLYYIPSRPNIGGRLLPLRESQAPPKAAELATSEPIPKNLTIHALRGWIRWKSARLPILPVSDDPFPHCLLES